MRSILNILNQNSLEKLYLELSTILFKYEKLLITYRFYYNINVEMRFSLLYFS